MSRTMPSRLRRAKLGMKGKDEIFVGRAEQLEDLIEFALRRQKSLQSCHMVLQTSEPATVITGAPGAGKTATLGMIREQLQQEGFGAVYMDASNILTKESFGEQMARAGLESVMQKADELWQERWQQIQTWVEGKRKKQPKGVRGVVFRHMAKLSKIVGRAKLRPVATELQSAWELVASKKQSPFVALRLMDIAFPHGWLLCVDEVQGLHSATESDFITQLLRNLSTSDTRLASGLLHGNLIMAGLNDSVEVLEDRNITRIEYETLRPLTQQEATQIITQHMARGCAVSGVKATGQHRQWANDLAGHYHVWAHHTKAAALAAEWVMEHEPTSPYGLEWIHEKTKMRVKALYDGRLSRNDSVVPRAVVGSIIGQYHANGNRMTYDQLAEIIAIAQQSIRFKSLATKDINDVRRTLLHSGVFSKDSSGGLSVPIPSLLTYCLETLPVDDTLIIDST